MPSINHPIIFFIVRTMSDTLEKHAENASIGGRGRLIYSLWFADCFDSAAQVGCELEVLVESLDKTIQLFNGKWRQGHQGIIHPKDLRFLNR